MITQVATVPLALATVYAFAMPAARRFVPGLAIAMIQAVAIPAFGFSLLLILFGLAGGDDDSPYALRLGLALLCCALVGLSTMVVRCTLDTAIGTFGAMVAASWAEALWVPGDSIVAALVAVGGLGVAVSAIRGSVVESDDRPARGPLVGATAAGGLVAVLLVATTLPPRFADPVPGGFAATFEDLGFDVRDREEPVVGLIGSDGVGLVLTLDVSEPCPTGETECVAEVLDSASWLEDLAVFDEDNQLSFMAVGDGWECDDLGLHQPNALTNPTEWIFGAEYWSCWRPPQPTGTTTN